ncbi:MAG: FAD-binding protein [Bacteroidetes bacterium]|jgi:succinate dehydrogenase/fumarate reductase flavoprotein subunit|nr:FAD-binding protein [Bacteroidota bacterium]MBT4400303.1 FAD-binding protein [Bacteroidota bacterium]MBT4408529.1 FAD-binding protein [Bacteroidota bacterium]MBT5426653.1 FAD-binding protein [Bacteroidota bacterium]MBT7092499.1 FAD-binding protein [Bacteroidota bacterium]
MHKEKLDIAGINFEFLRLDALVIGSGAAGLNAAVQLHENGIEKISVITEKWGGGTSNNAGSDKQTYHRLAADGPEGDSVLDMAESLFKGGAMHGDIALIEAALSSQAFYNLVSAGVPFPFDRYGRFPGYLTDHDPKGRGTSAGPLTSKLMFEALARKVVEANIPILDRYQVIKLLTTSGPQGDKLIGVLALSLGSDPDAKANYLLIQAENTILATGGPGGLYEASVYPESQVGAMGLAMDIGAKACNLTESQFGIASTKFRWNLSGSYQQVIPRYYSVDEAGREYEFLSEYFTRPADLINAIFLKGYQWPFDARKVDNQGSSLIDLLVYQEKYIFNRRVFIDYRSNLKGSDGEEISISEGGDLLKEYLANSNVNADTPILRLEQMNRPAIDLYRRNRIDLYTEALEIDVCAQHCNGGLVASVWWESNISNLFPVGEVNGSHGVYRPGGSALNAGQVGGIRASQMIKSRNKSFKVKRSAFIYSVENQIYDLFNTGDYEESIPEAQNNEKEFSILKTRMSESAGFIRNEQKIKKAILNCLEQKERVFALSIPTNGYSACELFRLREHLISQLCFLKAIDLHIANGGESRGSYIILKQTGSKSLPWVNKTLCYDLEEPPCFTSENQLQLWFADDELNTEWQEVRSIPVDTEWFETLWKDFRNNKIVGS